MRADRVLLAKDLKEKILAFDQGKTPLPGIINPLSLDCLVLQIIDSIRRIEYIRVIQRKSVSNIYINASSLFFDPLKAASWCISNNMLDEAFWLVFLSVHFGKNKKSGWVLAREIYGGIGSGGNWTWQRISQNFLQFRSWLDSNNVRLRGIGNFGNHRKYQSLDAFSSTGTGNAIGSYIEWVSVEGSHEQLIQNASAKCNGDPREMFDYLYRSMNDVVSFGRTARFDYLTMIGKFDLASIEPGSTYMENATGPKRGAKLLFGGSSSSKINDSELKSLVASLESHLQLYFGMQVLEDALCNWQKNPTTYIHFVG